MAAFQAYLFTCCKGVEKAKASQMSRQQSSSHFQTSAVEDGEEAAQSSPCAPGWVPHWWAMPGRMPARDLLAICHAATCLGHFGEEEPSEARYDLMQCVAFCCSAELGVAQCTQNREPWASLATTRDTGPWKAGGGERKCRWN